MVKRQNLTAFQNSYQFSINKIIPPKFQQTSTEGELRKIFQKIQYLSFLSLSFQTINQGTMSKVANSAFIHNSQHECRICFETQQTPQNILISPCLCRGSVQYIHEECIRKWINRTLKGSSKQQFDQIMRKNSIDCELCHEQIVFTYSKKCECKSCGQIHQMIKESSGKRIIFFIIIMVIFAFFFYSFIIILQIILQQKSLNVALVIIFILLNVAFVVSLSLVSYWYLSSILVYKVKINKIGGKPIPKSILIQQYNQRNNQGESREQMQGEIFERNIRPAHSQQYFWHEQ